MEFAIATGPLHELNTDCLVVGVFDHRTLSAEAAHIDEVCGGALTRVLNRGDLDGKIGQSLLLAEVAGIKADRVMLLGCGKTGELNSAAFQKVLNLAARALGQTGASHCVICCDSWAITDQPDSDWVMREAVLALQSAQYRFDQLKHGDEQDNAGISRAEFYRQESSDSEPVTWGQAVANGVDLAKNLGNLPGNVCTPTFLAETAQDLDSAYDNISTEILEQADMEELGMGSLLSVTQGSRQPAKLIVMNYRGGPSDQAPVVLVGKGITFDAGGISLKPGAAMDEMKYDMCGAASVFGAISAVAEANLPLNLIVVVPSCENLPDGKATKPGDVVTAMDGTTIEVLNTDAEGRLVLCDALSYAAKFEPDCIVDVATLTGACIVALGRKASGLYSNNDNLADELLAAGTNTYDRAWRMPLWPEYKEQLKSNFADLGNIGGPDGGSITAASFLSHFTEKQTWAHLDIAGTAWVKGDAKGATGRPVPMLCQFLKNRAG